MSGVSGEAYGGSTIVETTDGGKVDVLIDAKGVGIGEFYLLGMEESGRHTALGSVFSEICGCS
jgi:hypothetical protein